MSDILNELKQDINKEYKGRKLAYFLNGDDEVISDVKDWISTGSILLDLALSNRKNGGLPLGRIIELSGQSSAGKSLVCAHIAKNTQDKGGVVIYFDTEQATSKEYLQAIGVDFDKMLYIETMDLEKIFNIIDSSIAKIKEINPKTGKSKNNNIVTIIIDSISATDSEANKEDKFNLQGYNTQQARLMSKALKHIHFEIAKENVLMIFTSQLRTKMNVMFGDPYCVDPHSTFIDIRYPYLNIERQVKEYKYENISLTDFSDRFANNDDLENPEIFDIVDKQVQILTYNSEIDVDQYSRIKTFVIKEPVNSYYTDGKLKGTSNHTVIDITKKFANNKMNITTNELKLKDHPDFHKVNEKMLVVDMEVEKYHTYYANGRLNHNTSASHGKALEFYADGRIRLKYMGKIKSKRFGQDEVIGVKAQAEIVKNRFGPAFRSVPMSYYFDRGIDDFENWLEFMKSYDLITKVNRGSKGTYYQWTDKSLKDDAGEFIVHDFAKSKIHEYLEEHKDVYTQMYDAIAEKYIMIYAQSTSEINEDDISVDLDGAAANAILENKNFDNE